MARARRSCVAAKKRETTHIFGRHREKGIALRHRIKHGTVDALAREGRDDVFALGVSYVAWFASVAVLHATKERARRLGGAAFNSAADRHSAELFRFFGVKVKQVSGTGTAFPLIMMVGLLPGILAGFLANWIWTARYDIQCSRGWTRATPGVHSCSADKKLCCKFPDERLEVFTFIAFFTGNVIAGYQVVKFCATCLLAYGEKHRHVEGGQTAVQQANKKLDFGTSSRLRHLSSASAGGGARSSGSSLHVPVVVEGSRGAGSTPGSLASQDAIAEGDKEGDKSTV